MSRPRATVSLRNDGPPTHLTVGTRVLRATVAFRSYWRIAAERQQMFFRRLRGEPPPWTSDPILSAHRFTNAYRASDRVSQFLINQVIYGVPADERSIVLRILLFKVFNRVETWRLIEDGCGQVTVANFDVEYIAEMLDRRLSAGDPLYSAAYIMPNPKLGSPRKHTNHLRLLQRLLTDGTIDHLVTAKSLRELYEQLAKVHSFGPFLAFQFAIDLNYSPLYEFSEMDFVIAGPGARDGIAKCFIDAEGVKAEDVIRAAAEGAQSLLAEAGIQFSSLWGRPLQLIDCQNLFCETDKYARVAHPDLKVHSGRTQIKQRYRPSNEPLSVAYPPKWGLPSSDVSEQIASGSCDCFRSSTPSRVRLSLVPASAALPALN